MKNKFKIKKSSLVSAYMLVFLFINITTILTSFLYLVIRWIALEYYDASVKVMDSMLTFIIILIAINLISGIFYFFYVVKLIINPLFEINLALDKIKEENYATRIDIKNPFFVIKNLINNFNDMAKKLDSVDTVKNDFIASMSHELKTPLAAISGYSELFKNDNITKEEANKCITVIEKNATYLSTLAEDILTISKFDNEQIINQKETYSLDEQIKQAIIFMEPKWQAKNIEFDLNLENINILANKSTLQHIWYNIISNAIKFSDDNSVISVEAVANQNDVKVSVSDTGCGISEEAQKHIFEKFYQADTSRSCVGNGLGLAIVKRILDIYNSEITVESELGKGSTFTVTLKNIIP